MNAAELKRPHLAVLSVLGTTPVSGKDLRKRLADFGIRKSKVAFYTIMARLEAEGMVEGWYSPRIVGGWIFHTKHYRITEQGIRVPKFIKASFP